MCLCVHVKLTCICRGKGRERAAKALHHCIKALRAIPRSLEANAIATIRVSEEAVKKL